MKQVFAFLVAIVLVTCIFWQDRFQITEKADEDFAKVIEFFQGDLEDHNVVDDLNSEEYFKDNTFLFAKYAKDLGYHRIFFPKKNDTLLVFRRGEKKIVAKKDGTIIFSIHGDQFEDGIIVHTFVEENDCYISFGKNYDIQKTSKEEIIQVAIAMIHLRENDTLMEMVLDNRQDDEKIIENPKILKGFF